MRRIGFFTLALLVLLAVPAWGQDPRVARPTPAVGPTGPTSLWIAISSTTARISGRVTVRGWDPKGPAVQAIKLNSSKNGVYRAFALDDGGTGTLDLEVSDEVVGQAQAPGDPIPDIDVSLAKLDGKAIVEHRTARTDAAGRFVFDNVPPGGYELSWQVHGRPQFQQVWIEPPSSGRETGLEAACRRKCAAEHTNAQGHLNADAYGACLRECMAGAAMCPVPDDDAAHREPCPEDRPACPAGEDITCVRGRWVCIGAAEPSR